MTINEKERSFQILFTNQVILLCSHILITSVSSPRLYLPFCLAVLSCAGGNVDNSDQ